MNKLGLYIHVPFCLQKCAYCDFYSVTDQNLQSGYVDSLLCQMERESKRCESYLVDTIYIGGGTPSLLRADDIERIFKTIHAQFCVSDQAEVTIEVNPSSVTQEKVGVYAACGVNRVSIGLQSSHDEELAMLGRLHDRSLFEKAYDLLRYQFQNINIDIMYGLPYQTLTQLAKTLDYIAVLQPEHVSAYCLKVEERTALADLGFAQPDEDMQFRMYASVVEQLQTLGLWQYEISNFARKGLVSKHNMKYWSGESYLGFGPGAYSYFTGKRYGLPRDLNVYMQRQYKTIDEEIITEQEAAQEKIIFGLRLTDGVSVNVLPKDRLPFYLENGFAVIENGQFKLTTKGFFVSNSILCDLID
ncbi:MAG: radical SAM family heme chaperone HemW [Clostridiales bacterium]|nr:radical SAM family heme chaperone HemW [Clostridiales bacterium]